MNFWTANEPFAVAACVILLGYVLKRTGLVREDAGEVLAKVALNFTLPAVILLNVPTFPLTRSTMILPLLPPAASVVAVLIALYLFRNQSVKDRGLSMTASAGFNLSLFAIPIVTGLYGAEGVARFAVMDLGNAVTILGLGYYLAFRFSPHRNGERVGVLAALKALFSSVPFITFMVALVMNLTGVRIHGFLQHVVEVPAAMNRGVSFLVLGILLRFSFPPGTWRAILPPLVLRYVFGIAAAAVILFLLPIETNNRIALASAMIMPVGLTIIPFSVKWGYDRDRAAALLNTGIPVSFALLWVVWVLGEHLPFLQP